MTWDVTTPAGSDQIRNGDNIIRELKADLQTALQSAGTFPGPNPASPIFQPIPSGIVLDYAGASPPTGWVLCDGASYLRAGTYANLFAAIGTAFGAADGTHFSVPLCNGRTTIGVGTLGLYTRVLADTAGEVEHTLSAAEMPTHTHVATVTDPTHDHAKSATSPSISVDSTGSTRVALYATGTGGGRTDGNATGVTVANANTGSGGAHNNMQPYIVMTKIIKI